MTYLQLSNNKVIVPLLYSKDFAFNKPVSYTTKKVCTVVNIPGMAFRPKIVTSTKIKKTQVSQQR